MYIFCCNCNTYVDARFTNGSETYPHRQDLSKLNFWKCDTCEGFVGCHNKHHIVKKRKDPLGVIPSPRIKKARNEIHKILEPLWKNRKYSRTEIYKMISEHIGTEYHTAQLSDIDTAKKVYRFLKKLEKN